MVAETLVRKHLTAFFVLVALPVLAVILVISLLFREEVVRIARERTLEAVERTSQNLETETLGFALFTSALVNDRSLLEHAAVYARTNDPEERFDSSKGLEASVSWFFRITSRIGSVFLFLPNGRSFYYSNYPASSIDLDHARSLCFDPARPPGEVWCLDGLSALPGSTERPPVVSMAVRPRPGDRRSSGVEAILVSFRIPFLDDMYAGGGRAAGTRFLVDRSGSVMLSNRRDLVGLSFRDIKESFDGDFLVVETTMKSTGWTFAEAVPYSAFTRNVLIMMRYVAAAFLLVIVLFALYTVAFFSGIIEPLKTEHRERTKAEIEALRYQLNPHFVCNTLNAIGMMAQIAKVDSIRRMATALTRIMRETLSADDTVLSLEKELGNLESYVYIMKIRYGDSFSFRTDVDSRLLNAGVPTMLLQPLVENAVLHGIRGLRPGRTVTVSAQREGAFVRLSVRDDGVGIPPERLAEVLSSPGESRRGFNRIGLHNVRRRILLSYGPPCGLTVESRPGEGTLVSAVIPHMPASDRREEDS